MNLSSMRREIEKHVKGLLLVKGGPGNGKTRALTERIKNLTLRGPQGDVKTALSLRCDCLPFAQALLTKRPYEVGPPHEWRRRNGQNDRANFLPTPMISLFLDL
jgi:hypothetical protein